jgi:hypothetical protein
MAKPARTKWKAEGKAGGTRRGVAVAKDLGLVYTLGTGNSLVALDIATGVEKWRKAYTGVGNVAKVALVYHGKKLYIGTNDGSIGSGLMVDATDGTLLSNFWGVPQNPGDIGFDTWGGAPMNQRAGATPWLHPAVDPETNSVFWVFGNNRGGSSQNGSTRPGLNLFASSVVALDLKTGAYKWHFQTVHHDHWDMDNMSVVLADVNIAGQGPQGRRRQRQDGSELHPRSLRRLGAARHRRGAGAGRRAPGFMADTAASAPGRLDRAVRDLRAARRPGARQSEPRGAQLPGRLPLRGALGRRAGP